MKQLDQKTSAQQNSLNQNISSISVQQQRIQTEIMRELNEQRRIQDEMNKWIQNQQDSFRSNLLSSYVTKQMLNDVLEAGKNQSSHWHGLPPSSSNSSIYTKGGSPKTYISEEPGWNAALYKLNS